MFEKSFPYLNAWIKREGWIALGADHYSYSLVRIINEGAVIWEDKDSETLEEALQKAEAYLKNDLEEEWDFVVRLE